MNERFEDPCWGSKYRLNGIMIDEPALRDLDQYAFEMWKEQVLVDMGQLVLGKCRHLSPAKSIYTPTLWTKVEPPPLCDTQLTNKQTN